MMNWGDFVWGIFLREMKWDVFFFQPLKAPKNTHTKSDMIEKEWSFLFPNKCIHLCFYFLKHRRFQGVGGGKPFPFVFLCHFLKIEAGGLDSG